MSKLGITSFLREGAKQGYLFSLRRLLALGCALVFWYAIIRLIEFSGVIQNMWVPLILAGLPFLGMIIFMFLTTWESFKELLSEWRLTNIDKDTTISDIPISDIEETFSGK